MYCRCRISPKKFTPFCDKVGRSTYFVFDRRSEHRPQPRHSHTYDSFVPYRHELHYIGRALVMHCYSRVLGFHPLD